MCGVTWTQSWVLEERGQLHRAPDLDREMVSIQLLVVYIVRKLLQSCVSDDTSLHVIVSH